MLCYVYLTTINSVFLNHKLLLSYPWKCSLGLCENGALTEKIVSPWGNIHLSLSTNTLECRSLLEPSPKVFSLRKLAWRIQQRNCPTSNLNHLGASDPPGARRPTVWGRAVSRMRGSPSLLNPRGTPKFLPSLLASEGPTKVFYNRICFLARKINLLNNLYFLNINLTKYF